MRISKKSRVGILNSITQFQTLAKSAIVIFGDSERRSDLDKWLEKLVNAVISGINTAAKSPNSKYPKAIVLMENLHALHCKDLPSYHM